MAEVSFLVFQVILKSLDEKNAVWLTIATVLGLFAALYFHIEWKRGRMTSTELVVWSAALPFGLALIGVYLHATMVSVCKQTKIGQFQTIRDVRTCFLTSCQSSPQHAKIMLANYAEASRPNRVQYWTIFLSTIGGAK